MTTDLSTIIELAEMAIEAKAACEKTALVGISGQEDFINYQQALYEFQVAMSHDIAIEICGRLKAFEPRPIAEALKDGTSYLIYDHFSPDKNKDGRGWVVARWDWNIDDWVMYQTLSYDVRLTNPICFVPLSALTHPQPGVKPSITVCDHKHWTWDKHGRRCTCGATMEDFGD